MSQPREEEKKQNDQSAHIDLKVKGQDGSEVFFRIKRSTQLKKLMNAYCDRQSVDMSSIAFLFDGRRLRAEQTPDELEMEDGDEIDAMLHRLEERPFIHKRRAFWEMSRMESSENSAVSRHSWKRSLIGLTRRTAGGLPNLVDEAAESKCKRSSDVFTVVSFPSALSHLSLKHSDLISLLIFYARRIGPFYFHGDINS
ncbi:hypothetical protein SAY87_027217 [Trapa incisa]|uniref:Ubiquitin-like domain-containing protein n=1 Tax=Trapa incisa TaxID=236973 RepID=A0AAN7JMH2_9MYRT|nr:hypothetical protein SAY87_027217 [Trapa incisa]